MDGIWVGYKSETLGDFRIAFRTVNLESLSGFSYSSHQTILAETQEEADELVAILNSPKWDELDIVGISSYVYKGPAS